MPSSPSSTEGPQEEADHDRARGPAPLRLGSSSRRRTKSVTRRAVSAGDSIQGWCPAPGSTWSAARRSAASSDATATCGRGSSSPWTMSTGTSSWRHRARRSRSIHCLDSPCSARLPAQLMSKGGSAQRVVQGERRAPRVPADDPTIEPEVGTELVEVLDGAIKLVGPGPVGSPAAPLLPPDHGGGRRDERSKPSQVVPQPGPPVAEDQRWPPPGGHVEPETCAILGHDVRVGHRGDGSSEAWTGGGARWARMWASRG